MAKLGTASSWKGQISVNLVNVPVKLYPAIREDKPTFRNGILNEEGAFETLQQVPHHPGAAAGDYGPPVDEETTPIVKGVKAGGSWIVVEPQELEELQAAQDKTIKVDRFIPLGDIDPLMFTKPYVVMPDTGGQSGYALLVAALRKTKRAAIGTFINSTKEYVVVVQARAKGSIGGVLVAQIVCYPAELVETAEYEDEVKMPLAKAEVDMAVSLVNMMAGPFDPERYVNHTGQAVKELIEAKARGAKPAAHTPAQAPKPSVDLMASLAASLEQMGKEKEATAAAQKQAAADKAAAKPKPATTAQPKVNKPRTRKPKAA